LSLVVAVVGHGRAQSAVMAAAQLAEMAVLVPLLVELAERRVLLVLDRVAPLLLGHYWVVIALVLAMAVVAAEAEEDTGEAVLVREQILVPLVVVEVVMFQIF
jgi:hypothetical protein